ncbi:MAG: hypothetical protein IPK60_21825 [Sandaracinaceae bacterium]|nr:hypothetical protein [Sandaracinaceae bacterium]
MTQRLIYAAAMLGLVFGTSACGDGDTGNTDAGPREDSGPPVVTCPATAPAPDNQSGACCARASNEGRLDAPELRIAALKLTAPQGTLTNALIQTVLSTAFDKEDFNWALQLQGAPTSGTGPVTVRTGYGVRDDATGHFAFADGNATAPGSADRWDPIDLTGTMTDEGFTTTPFHALLTIPVFDPDSATPDIPSIELPIYDLEVLAAPLAEMRTCIGTRGTSAYSTSSGGRLRGYIQVDDARGLMVTMGNLISTKLCSLIAGAVFMEADGVTPYCDATAQTDWTAKPDSLCSAGGCAKNASSTTPDVCEPTGAGGTLPACNAWQLLGEFAAQGVDID